jgi:hypothetical protein
MKEKARERSSEERKRNKMKRSRRSVDDMKESALVSPVIVSQSIRS